MSGPTRRAVLGGALALAAPALAASPSAVPARAAGEAKGWRHGLSAFGDLALPPGFAHLPYADPAAPKGGLFSGVIERTLGNQNFSTFNTLNPFVLRGDGAAGVELTFDSLMARNFDEPDALYGLVAEAARREADGPDGGALWRFRLREGARFHDRSPLTAEDAAWSVLALKAEGHPLFAQALRAVAGAEAAGPRELVLRLAPGAARDLVLTVAGLPILSRASFTARPFDAATLEPLLGSGPYRVGRFEPGRFVELERTADYWAADLPVNRGRHNFDRLRTEYFRDRDVAFEGFKSRVTLFREEFTARTWAAGYDFPAAKDGRVVRATLPDETPSGAQGWFLNLRRPAFRDPRAREAIDLAFDFEWTNRQLMNGAYRRTASFFEGSPFKAEGPPPPEELALLEPHRAALPPEAFGEPVAPAAGEGTGTDRDRLRRAGELLAAAGCRRGPDGLLLPSGERFAVEFLDRDGSLQRHTEPFAANLRRLGIDARLRTVDPAQYQRRVDARDFDVVSQRFSLPLTPGEELRSLFGAEAAALPGSRNLAGIGHPAVDALCRLAADAPDRAALTTALRALDRCLRALRPWVPMWHKGSHTLAWWDAFGRPAAKPRYDRGAPATWWWDEAKARALGLQG